MDGLLILSMILNFLFIGIPWVVIRHRLWQKDWSLYKFLCILTTLWTSAGQILQLIYRAGRWKLIEEEQQALVSDWRMTTTKNLYYLCYFLTNISGFTLTLVVFYAILQHNPFVTPRSRKLLKAWVWIIGPLSWLLGIAGCVLTFLPPETINIASLLHLKLKKAETWSFSLWLYFWSLLMLAKAISLTLKHCDMVFTNSFLQPVTPEQYPLLKHCNFWLARSKSPTKRLLCKFAFVISLMVVTGLVSITFFFSQGSSTGLM